MKLILSRKGWDSSYGGGASPIHATTQAIASLPIPLAGQQKLSGRRHATFGDLQQLAHDLARHTIATTYHLDPDLSGWAGAASDPQWAPSLGQDGAAQSHLKNQCVDDRDLFLFFGWFRQVEQVARRWRYVRGTPDIHLIFGWLQVGQKLLLTMDPAKARQEVESKGLSRLANHPHVAHASAMKKNNTLYVAAPTLNIGGMPLPHRGGGAFATWRSDLQLTEVGQTCRSVWRLPRWFMPTGAAGPTLSCHGNPALWQRLSNGVRLRSRPIGQEFVIDIGANPAALAWVRSLF